MKTPKLIALMMVALALSATPAMAQRSGGSRSGGGHSSSMGSSRSSGGSFSSSRSSSSSSRGSSFSSSSSRSSSSSSRSSSSYSTPSSRSSSSSSGVTRGSSSRRAPEGTFSRSAAGSTRGAGTVSRGESGRHMGVSGREAGRTTPRSDVGSRSTGTFRGEGSRSGATTRGEMAPTRGESTSRAGGGVHGAPAGAVSASGRIGSSPNVRTGYEGSGLARPGRPGGHMPPADRPIHPAPYFHHPWHGYMVHCHPIFWDPIPPRPWYWPGFWVYCNSYWYDYHVTDVEVVRHYVQDTYHVDMITYGISGDIMYAIVRDGGQTYLQVYDKDDHLLAEQKINKKYCNMVIDSENGGCWISKKNNKDPLLFIWAEGQLLIYEAD